MGGNIILGVGRRRVKRGLSNGETRPQVKQRRGRRAKGCGFAEDLVFIIKIPNPDICRVARDRNREFCS